MLKMIGKGSIASVISILSATVAVGGECDAFVAEADAFEGLVPKFNEDGTIRSLSMYGEGTFLVPKRSLISEARQEAQDAARKAFSEFMRTDFDAERVASKMIETIENTDNKGNTSGSVEEIKTSLNIARSSTSGAQSGVVKLDECVDTEGNFVLVRMGWKPEMSEAAADTRATINSEIARGEAGETASDKDSDKIKEADGYRKKSSLADDF